MQIRPVVAMPSPEPSTRPDPNTRCNPNKPSFPVENGHWIWDDQWMILCDSERGIGTVHFFHFIIRLQFEGETFIKEGILCVF